MRWFWQSDYTEEAPVAPKPKVTLTTKNTNYDTVTLEREDAGEWEGGRVTLTARIEGGETTVTARDRGSYMRHNSGVVAFDTEDVRAWCRAVLVAVGKDVVA